MLLFSFYRHEYRHKGETLKKQYCVSLRSSHCFMHSAPYTPYMLHVARVARVAYAELYPFAYTGQVKLIN